MNEQPQQGEQTINTNVALPGAGSAAPVVAAPQPRQVGGMRRLLLLNGVILGAIILIGLGAFWLWHQGYYFYSTDDAAVTGTNVAVAVPAAGSVQSVVHTLGSTVKAGDTIATVQTLSGTILPATSPIAGTIISEGATQGEVLPAGQPLAQVMDLNSLFITAYVEETRIRDVAVGQGVDVNVDAIKDNTFHGHVTRILPATAGTFSLLPTTDYASGNFTKVTQRVPVQITLDSYQGYALYPGESTSVTIHIHS
jgi:multidrug resistance efflux pump